MTLRPAKVPFGSSGDAVPVEQLVDERRHQAAAPWPATDLAEAFLVDIEDHDALVDAAGHRQAQARVVDDVVEAGNEADLVEAGGVPSEEQRNREADRDSYKVLFQLALEEEFHFDAGQ